MPRRYGSKHEENERMILGIPLPRKAIVEDEIRTLRRINYGEEEI